MTASTHMRSTTTHTMVTNRQELQVYALSSPCMTVGNHVLMHTLMRKYSAT